MVSIDGVDRSLSRREREVLQEVAAGMSNREIGERLNIAEQTVKNHLGNAMRKLELHDRTRAVVVAMGHGLIAVPITDGTVPGAETLAADMVAAPTSS